MTQDIKKNAPGIEHFTQEKNIPQSASQLLISGMIF